ncbi:MAG: hypothetical protein ABR907_15775 [Terracidiphilus sp.]|jgi:hypothetical protein
MTAKTGERARVLDENGAVSGQKVGKMGGLQLLNGKYEENASR